MTYQYAPGWTIQVEDTRPAPVKVPVKVEDPNATIAEAVAPKIDTTEAEARYVRRVKGLVADNQTAGVKTANAAILAAALTPNSSVIIPAGTYYTDPLTVVGPVNIEGESIATTLRNNDGSVLVLSGSQINVSKLTLRSTGGGHTIRQNGHLDQCHFDRVRLYHESDGYSIWDNAGYRFIDMRFMNFLSWHTQTATVPAWNLVGAGGIINNNVWAQFRAQFSGNYHFNVETTDVTTQFSNVWRDATWEVTTGGMIRLIGNRDYVIDNSTVWDLASGAGGVVTLKKHGILADTNAANALCIGTIRNHRRLDGTCDPGIQDIKLPSGTSRGAGTVIERCQNITSGNPLLIDLNSNEALVVNPGASASTLTTLSNTSATQIINKDGITVPATQSFKVGTVAAGLGFPAAVSADPPSVPANSEVDFALTVTGAAAGDACTVSTGSALEAGLGIVGCWATSNTVTVRLRNFTGAAIDPSARTWRVRVWR